MSKESEKIDGKVKSFLASKTIWGIIIALSPVLSGWLGFDVDESIGDIYEPLIQVIGAVIATYGRIKASSGLKLKKNK